VALSEALNPTVGGAALTASEELGEIAPAWWR
jgi:hypothetical protein